MIPKNPIAGIVALLGIVSSVAALAGMDFRILIDYGMVIYGLIDFVYIAACILAGLGMLLGNRVLAGTGAFIAAAGELIKAYDAIDLNRGYAEYQTQYMIYLIGMLAGCAAFVLFGVMMLRNRWGNMSAAKVISIVLMVITTVAEIIYAFRFFDTSYYTFGEFIGKWLTGYFISVLFIFLMIGFVIYMFMADSNDYKAAARPAGVGYQTAAYDPSSFANPYTNMASYSAPQSMTPTYNVPTNNPQNQSSPSFSTTRPAAPVSAPLYNKPQPSASTSIPPHTQAKAANMDERGKAEAIKRYKELLDENVLTQEEFDAKREHILSL